MVEACGESRGLETGIAQRTRTHSLFMIMHSIFHFLIEYKLIMYTDINTPSKNNDKVNYVHTIHLWLLSQGADNSSTHFKEFHGIVSLGATGSAQFRYWTSQVQYQSYGWRHIHQSQRAELIEIEVHNTVPQYRSVSEYQWMIDRFGRCCVIFHSKWMSCHELLLLKCF